MSRSRGKYAKQKAGGKGRTGLKILIVLLSLILLFLVVVMIGLNYVMGKIGRIEPITTIPPEQQHFETDETLGADETAPPVVQAEDVTWDNVEPLYNQDIINVLLVGQDRREGEGRARSDSMILASINSVKNTIHLTSFMRDLYVQIPGGYADNRINAAYSMGGVDLLSATLEKNFGIQLDGIVEVDFGQFETIVEILGGVDVEMNSEESNYMNYSEYQAGPTQPGWNHLNGYQALIFARMRKLSGNDFGRTERQRRLLMAIADSLKTASFVQVKDLINQVLPYVTTNLTDDQILSYATSAALLVVDGVGVETGRVPADDAYYDATINGMMVLVPYLDRCRAYLDEFIYAN